MSWPSTISTPKECIPVSSTANSLTEGSSISLVLPTRSGQTAPGVWCYFWTCGMLHSSVVQSTWARACGTTSHPMTAGSLCDVVSDVSIANQPMCLHFHPSSVLWCRRTGAGQRQKPQSWRCLQVTERCHPLMLPAWSATAYGWPLLEETISQPTPGLQWDTPLPASNCRPPAGPKVSMMHHPSSPGARKSTASWALCS